MYVTGRRKNDGGMKQDGKEQDKMGRNRTRWEGTGQDGKERDKVGRNRTRWEEIGQDRKTHEEFQQE
jgi:hypothetical protein